MPAPPPADTKEAFGLDWKAALPYSFPQPARVTLSWPISDNLGLSAPNAGT